MMNTQFESMFSEAEGRYLLAGETRKLDNYAKSLENRIAAMQALEQAESKILEETNSALFRAMPELESNHFEAVSKSERDMRLVLRYCALAMVRDDQGYLEEKLLHWLRTILHAFKFPRALDIAYRTLAERTEAHLEPQHAALVVPYIRLTHSVLTQG